MLDAVGVAMSKLGHGGVRLAIPETGWPNGGDYDQIGAKVRKPSSTTGTSRRGSPATPARRRGRAPGCRCSSSLLPLQREPQARPGHRVPLGPLLPQRHGGVPQYQVDLTGWRPLWAYPPLPAADNNTPYKGPIWCVLAAHAGRKLNETAVGDALTYACGQKNGTCDAIQPDGECFQPYTGAAHARYAFNSYWQQLRKTGVHATSITSQSKPSRTQLSMLLNNALYTL